MLRLAVPANGFGGDKRRARETADVFLVPRAFAESHKTANEVRQAIRLGQTPGVVQQWFDWRETVPSWTGDKTTITYRVQRTKSGDGVELVRTSWNPLWQWYTAVGFVTVAVVIGGFWMIRRMRSRPVVAAK